MTLSAVLLAGGKSRRMGQDKAMMRFGAAPLWQIQLHRLRKLQPTELFVSAQIDPGWRPADVKFVPDNQPARGPISGIAATLSRMNTDHLLAVAIDMAFMTENYLRELCEHIGPNRGVVPTIEDRFEPLAAIYPRSAHLDFVDALSGNEFSLQPLIRKLIATRKLRPLQVSEQDWALFRNLNQPQDL